MSYKQPLIQFNNHPLHGDRDVIWCFYYASKSQNYERMIAHALGGLKIETDEFDMIKDVHGELKISINALGLLMAMRFAKKDFFEEEDIYIFAKGKSSSDLQDALVELLENKILLAVRSYSSSHRKSPNLKLVK